MVSCKPRKITIEDKEFFQAESDLYIYEEGSGMMQEGGIRLMQKTFHGWQEIVFGHADIKRLITVLKSEKLIPVVDEQNCDEFTKHIQQLKEEDFP
jgi:hypothetical protein